jgi:hypothetical protein
MQLIATAAMQLIAIERIDCASIGEPRFRGNARIVGRVTLRFGSVVARSGHGPSLMVLKTFEPQRTVSARG